MDIKGKTDRELLEGAYELSLENNRMFHAQRREAFIGGIIKFIIWAALFFVVPYLIYAFYLKPYMDQLQSMYQGAQEQTSALQNLSLPEGFDLNEMIQKLFPKPE
jgi:hypothetical protein